MTPFLLFLNLLLGANALQAQTIRDANELYKQGQYVQAARNYQNLADNHPDVASLHYNLGNALFKQAAPGALGRAIAEYWKAYRLDPRDGDIRYNLDFSLKKAGEALVPAGMPWAIYLAYHALSEAELLGLQWIGYGLCMVLGALYWFRPDARSKLRPWLTFCAAFWIFFGAWWGMRRMTGISQPGVVIEPNSEARSGPGTNFPVSFNAPEGRRVSILSEEGDWLEIGVLKEGLRGWVPAKDVERI